MTDSIYPHGEKLRNAVRWLSEQGDHSLKAIDEVSLRFDLSPRDTEFLIRTFAQSGDTRTSQKGPGK